MRHWVTPYHPQPHASIRKTRIHGTAPTAQASSPVLHESSVRDRFLLPLHEVDPQAKAILSNANFRLSWGSYASADLAAQAGVICFVRNVTAD